MDGLRTCPEGFLVGKWMATGLVVFGGAGVPLSFALDEPGLIGLWPGMGMVIGLAIGTALEARYRAEGRLRPPTEGERRNRSIAVAAGVGLLALGAVLFTAMFLLL